MVAAAKKAANAPLRGADKAAAKKAQKVEEKSKEMDKFGPSAKVEEFAATNIDDALDLLNSTGKSGAGSSSNAAVERHPERRAKAAYVYSVIVLIVPLILD